MPVMDAVISATITPPRARAMPSRSPVNTYGSELGSTMVKSRWRPSYPENTGDIATTFLKDPRRRAADSAALPSSRPWVRSNG